MRTRKCERIPIDFFPFNEKPKESHTESTCDFTRHFLKPMTVSSRLEYILSKAQVPRPHKLQIRRRVYEKFEAVAQRFLDEGIVSF
jgi:hypothetical protein